MTSREPKLSFLEKVGATVLFGPPLIAILTVLSLPFAIIRAFVLAKLWLWFVVPTLRVPALTVPAAMGLMFTVSMLIPYTRDFEKEGETMSQKVTLTIVRGVVAPLLVLAIGAVLHRWW